MTRARASSTTTAQRLSTQRLAALRCAAQLATPRCITISLLARDDVSQYYYATMPSLDLINRCLPLDSSSLTQDEDRCAFPQCDNQTYAPCDETYPTTWKMTYPLSLQCEVRFRVGQVQQLETAASDTLARAIGQHAQGAVQAVESVMESQTEVLLFGLAMPIVCGLVWLILLRLFAATIIYLSIILLGLTMALFTIYCFIAAGVLDELFSYNSTLTVSNSSAEVLSWANDTLAQALGLVDSASDAIVSLAPSELTSAISDTSASPTIWYICGGLGALVTFVYLLSMCLARKKIKTCVALVKASTMVIKSRPFMMAFPFGTLLAQVGCLVFFALLAAFLTTADLNKEHFISPGSITALAQGASFVEKMLWYNTTIASGDGASKIASMDDSASSVQAVVYLYVLFGFLWTSECISNVSWTSLSGCVGHWFFFREDPKGKTRVPLLRSLGRVLRYHLGSIAFGSFIIAVVRLIRLILLAIDKYTKDAQNKNLLLKLTIKCVQCCMYCLEKTLKYITDYAYIYVALQGSSFCGACFATFSLITRCPSSWSHARPVGPIACLFALLT